MTNDYMVNDLDWNELYIEMIRGRITLEDFKSYMTYQSNEYYQAGIDDTLKEGREI